ncbi:GNAT family N-acetyltransferase [Paenibacillus sp. USDA918EY]|uniref:GNAT family N-acetyltransferase n=1 Tax=Paenibacillus sp. USDA918EY TaxID=2689575 RepID=UPI0013588FEC|nr:GNAT family N-acetyltransferase [Paenibacillus sp. USDA918EY]
MEVSFKNYLISDDRFKINREIVLDFLSKSYWAKNRAPERILKSIETSHCYGVYCEDNQIGFARVITDEATFYYICDVFVLEEYRGQGIGKKLIETIVHSERYEWMTGLLGTADAHGLYEQYGFEKDPERYMRRAPQSRMK